MYESFYNFSANPFKLAPDSRFCFSHTGYEEARAYLEYAFELGEGFVVFTGRPGTGKTTLIQSFLGNLDMSEAIAARLALPNMNAEDLLRAVANAYDVGIEGMDTASVLHRLERFFAREVRSGKRILLIIDEAQGLSHSAIEELRMLADLQIDSRFLLQVFLVGQEKLRELMNVPEMEQFQQRVTGTCKLVPLNLKETRNYMEYRLSRVGWLGDPELTGAAVHAVFQHSEGIPRHINKLCTRLLLHGLLEEKHVLDSGDVFEVAEGLKDEQLAPMQQDCTVPGIDEQASQAKQAIESEEDDYAELALRSANIVFQPPERVVSSVRRSGAGRAVNKAVPSNEPGVIVRRDDKAGGLQKVVGTELYRWGVGKVSDFSGYIKRFVEPVAVLGASVLLTLFLVALFVNEEGIEGQSNSAEEQVRAAVKLDSGMPRSTGFTPVREPAEPIPVVEFDYSISEMAAIELHKLRSAEDSATTSQPESLQHQASMDKQTDVAVADDLPPADGAAMDSSKQAETTIILAQADIRDPVAIASVEAGTTVVPGAGAAEEKVSAEKARKGDIRRLLSLAQESLRDYRLLIPEGNNAYEYYRQIEALDPGNKDAVNGFQKIKMQYVELAEKAMKRGDDDSANLYIMRGLRVHPGDDELLALQLGMMQPEVVRVKAYVPPVEDRHVPLESTTLFSRIRGIVNKNQPDTTKPSIWHDEEDVW